MIQSIQLGEVITLPRLYICPSHQSAQTSYNINRMELSCPYKILPFPLTCDTLFLSFSRHYDVKYHQYSDSGDLLALLRTCEQTYKIVVLADNYEQGLEHIAQIREIKRSAEQQKIAPLRDSEGLPSSNEDVDSHVLTFSENSITKSSSMYLKNFLNETNSKIESLRKELGRGWEYLERQKSVNRSDKRCSKELKIKEKQLEEMQDRRLAVEKELRSRNEEAKWREELAEDQLLAQSEG